MMRETKHPLEKKIKLFYKHNPTSISFMVFTGREPLYLKRKRELEEDGWEVELVPELRY